MTTHHTSEPAEDTAAADEPAMPSAFTFFTTEATARGEAITRRLQKMAKADVRLPRETVMRLGQSLDLGDRLGDAWFGATVEQASPRKAREDFHLAMERGVDAVPNASPQLRALFDQINTEPDWLDWDMLEHGAEVFRRYGKELYPYFGMATFDGYRTPSVTKPLILTGAYTGNSALNRFWETCKHWTDTSEPHGMRPGNPGLTTSLRVRLLHCMIRRRILVHPEWDRPHLGVPISQFNMLTTLMAGSFFVGQQLKLLGYRTSDDDILAMLHFWRYIGYVMGVEPAFYPESIQDGFGLMRVIALSQHTEDNDDSRRLCESFMNAYKPAPDATGLTRIREELNYRFQLGHAYFYTPQSYVGAGFPPIGLWRYAPLLRFVPNFLRETARLHIPGAAGLIDRRHRAYRQEELETTLGSRRGGFNPVEKLAR